MLITIFLQTCLPCHKTITLISKLIVRDNIDRFLSRSPKNRWSTLNILTILKKIDLVIKFIKYLFN